MPNIREFNAPQGLGLQPTETGVEATAQAARRIGGFFNQAAGALERTGQRFGSAVRDAGDVYVKYQDHKEISAGAANGSAVINGLSTQWNEAAKNADPNDPSVASKFRDEVMEPALTKFKQGFTTEKSQQWAEHFTDQYRQHMFEKTSADMSSMAADAVHLNVVKTANSLGNTVYNDPSSLKFAIGAAGSTIGGVADSSPNIDAKAATKIKNDLGFTTVKHLVDSAIRGTIAKGGDASKIINDPKYAPYIDQKEVNSYVQQDKAQKRAERVDESYARAEEKRQRQDDSDKAEEGYLQKLFSDDAKQRTSVTAKAIVNDDRLTRAAKEHFLNIVERETKPAAEARVSNKTVMEILPDIRSGKITDSGPIYQALGDGKLNRTDFGFLRKELEDLKTPQGEALSKDRTEFFKKFSPSIDIGKNPSILGSTSALGQLRTYQAEQDARRQEDVLRRAGKDPHAVYDPRSEYFFGRADNLKKYQPTLKEITDYESGLKKGGAQAPAVAPFEPFVVKPPADVGARKPVPPAAVQMLRNNPSMKRDFDEKYGPGQADKILKPATEDRPDNFNERFTGTR